MKKIILFLLFTSFAFAQETEAEKTLKFDKELKVKLEEFKKLPMVSEEARGIKIKVVEQISRYGKDPLLVNDAKNYLEELKTKKLDEVPEGSVDLTKISKEDLKNYRTYTDKFNQITFLTHKKMGFDKQIYIGIKNKNPYLRFSWTYRGSDWVFIDKIIFLIDGVKYEYLPKKIKRDVVSGAGVKEQFDDEVNDDMLPLLNAIANAKGKIDVRYIGDKTRDDSYINRMSAPFKETLDFYNSLK